jgi:multiple sugar transport system substrate-binding protein
MPNSSIFQRCAATAMLLVASAVSAVAQTIPSTIDEPVTIRFYNYNIAGTGIGKDATEEMIASFMAANPSVTVEAIPTPAPDVISIVQADVIAGNGPDLAQIIFADFGYVAENFGVPALEDIVPADELDGHLSGLFPNGLELGRLDGKTYGLAYVFSTPVLFYNADMFRAAGLNPDAPPRTWEEVSAAAMAIHGATGKPGLLTGIFGASSYDWLFQGFIRSNGGDVMTEDRSTLTFAEPEVVEALTMMRGIAQSGAMPNNTSTESIEAMSTGNAGMFLITSAVQATLLKGAEGNFDLRAAPMPTFGDKPATPTNSGSALMLMTQDPVKQRAAWELMKHLTSDYGYNIITSKIGYVPLRRSTVESEDFLAPFLRANPVMAPNIAQLETLTPWRSLPGPNYRQIMTTMMNAAEQAVFGEGDVATLMLDAQTTAQALMP